MSTRAIRTALFRAERVCTQQEINAALEEVDAIEAAASAIVRAERSRALTEIDVRGNRDGIALLERIAKEAGK